MGKIIFDCPSNTVAAAEQRFQRCLKPLLLLALESSANHTAFIENDELLICGVGVGKWRYISNFRLDNLNNLIFDYKDTVRIVDFGLMGFEKADGVKAVYERDLNNNICTIIDVRGKTI